MVTTMEKARENQQRPKSAVKLVRRENPLTDE